MTANLLCMVLGLVFLLLAALRVPEPSPSPAWGWLGLFFWLLSTLLR